MELSSHRIIILADPDAENDRMQDYLQLMGYEVQATNSVRQALDWIRDQNPDMLLLNLLLQERPGMLVLQDLRATEELSQLPILAMLDENNDEIIITALSNGANNILVRPFNRAELITRVQKEFEIAEYRQKLELANTKLENEKKGLTRFFPDDVVRDILAGRIQPELGGITTEATIMFLDIRGSTSLAEKLQPEEFVELLNLFFGDVIDIVFSNHGSVNKLLGDGLLATFGCPASTGNDAQNCAGAALKIIKHRDLFNSFRPPYLKHDLGVGIGIATSTVFAGNIGSQRLMEYTVIGDPVNLAARLQSLTKRFQQDILIDGHTHDRIKQKYDTLFLAHGQVRGKEKAVPIYTLRDYKN
ncbi:MAG: response regulator [Leptospiraceae bacterium]|nr:response regulator [Leptospiraceae bacterium]